MNPEEIINKTKTMKWEKWLDRPYHAFIFSLFEDSTRKESFDKIGINGVELRVQFTQKGCWYLNQEILEEMDAQVKQYLENHTMTDITAGLEEFKEKSIIEIKSLLASDKSVHDRFAAVYEILKLTCTYIWLAHGVESYYKRELNQIVPKYIKHDIDKFIGDASFPKKKNSHTLLEDMIRSEASLAEIAEKFGWMKVRDGFSEPFSIEDIEEMRAEIAPKQDHTNVEIPEELKEIFEQVQELVFFRTERTDVFSQLFYLSRPIIQELAEGYNIEFSKMKYYRAKSFLADKLEEYVPFSTFVYLDGEVLFQNDPIINDVQISAEEKIKGMVAYPGKIHGTVKVVNNITELEKVLSGDIMVAQMTFPSYISAMNRAVAFVTDEGGITCHAAIIAREMKKPCIVGTKIATKVLKDGDLVEVDADKGTVKILEGNHGHR